MPILAPLKRKKKQKKDAKVKFSPEKVFDVSEKKDIELSQDAARYEARKGQGGDRSE